MSERKKYDLTEGSIVNKLLLVAFPLMGTQFLQMAYNLTDMFWLGKVGSDAVAASGTAGMYLWLANGLLMIGRMGSEIGVSQSLGRGDRELARKFSQNALFLSLIAGILFGSVMVLLRGPLIGFFKIEEIHVAKDAADYLGIVGLAVPLVYLSGALTGTFNGAGNSRVPFYINFVGLGFNMIMDPVLILKLGMGIKGAAIATSAAQALVCAIFLIAVKKLSARPFENYSFLEKPERKRIVQIFRWSLPIAAESVLFTFLSMIVSRFVAAFGADAIAVQKVGSQIESLSWLVGGGFASAVTAYVGQNYGAGKWERIRRGFRLSVYLMIGWGLLITAILYFGAYSLVSLFLQEEEVIQMGVRFLHILATCQLVACLEFISAGAFRGMGKTYPPSLVSGCSNFIRIFIAYFLSRTSLGLEGIFWGVTIGSLMRGVWLFLWYQYDAGKQPKTDQETVLQE